MRWQGFLVEAEQNAQLARGDVKPNNENKGVQQ